MRTLREAHASGTCRPESNPSSITQPITPAERSGLPAFKSRKAETGSQHCTHPRPPLAHDALIQGRRLGPTHHHPAGATSPACGGASPPSTDGFVTRARDRLSTLRALSHAPWSFGSARNRKRLNPSSTCTTSTSSAATTLSCARAPVTPPPGEGGLSGLLQQRHLRAELLQQRPREPVVLEQLLLRRGQGNHRFGRNENPHRRQPPLDSAPRDSYTRDTLRGCCGGGAMLAPPFAFLVGSNPTAGSHRLSRRRGVPILGLPCEGSEAGVRGCASVCFSGDNQPPAERPHLPTGRGRKRDRARVPARRCRRTAAASSRRAAGGSRWSTRPSQPQPGSSVPPRW
jgi:hypothetical protein